MPIYDYTCSACGHLLETHQSMKDAPLTACPSCGKSALKRLASRGAGGAFCGRSFYRTAPGPVDRSGGSASLGQPPSAPSA